MRSSAGSSVRATPLDDDDESNDATLVMGGVAAQVQAQLQAQRQQQAPLNDRTRPTEPPAAPRLPPPVLGHAAPALEPERAPRKRSRSWGAPLVVAVLVAAAGSGIGWSMLRPVAVSTVAATKGDAIDAAYATAVVEARERVMVRARVAATVAELFAREGDVVTKGELLARLEAPGVEADLRRSQGELSAARAEMAAIQAELNNAREEAGRARALAKTEAISTAEANRATNGVTVVEARLAAARAKAGAIASDIHSRSTTGAKIEARELEVRAPLDGIVLRRDTSVGEVVPARAPLFDVAETHELLVECVVDEADLGRVTSGTRAVVSFRALKPRTFDGKVVEIARDANREKKSFIVKVQLAVMPPEVRTGMSAEVNLVLAERHDATLVAPGSVDGDAVWIVRNGRAHRQPVEVGVKSPAAVEIKSGINPGEAVILNFERVHEGTKVAPAPIAWSWAGRG